MIDIEATVHTQNERRRKTWRNERSKILHALQRTRAKEDHVENPLPHASPSRGMDDKSPNINRIRSLMQKQVLLHQHLKDSIEQNNQALAVAQKLPYERIQNILYRENVGLQNAMRDLQNQIEMTRRSLKHEYELSLENKNAMLVNAKLPL